MFSSRRIFLNQLRILLLASLVRTIFSQSRLGPLSAGPRITSMISPVATTWSMGTIRLFTLQPIIRLPTAEWMAYAKSMQVAPAGRLITSPLGVKAKTSSGSRSLLRSWSRLPESSDSRWFSSSCRTQASRSSSLSWPTMPSLYFQWAATPYSAISSIWRVRICTSKGIPSWPMTVV